MKTFTEKELLNRFIELFDNDIKKNLDRIIVLVNSVNRVESRVEKVNIILAIDYRTNETIKILQELKDLYSQVITG